FEQFAQIHPCEVQAVDQQRQRVGQLEVRVDYAAVWPERRHGGPEVAMPHLPGQMPEITVLPAVATAWASASGRRAAPQQPVAPDCRQGRTSGTGQGHRAVRARVEVDRHELLRSHLDQLELEYPLPADRGE